MTNMASSLKGKELKCMSLCQGISYVEDNLVYSVHYDVDQVVFVFVSDGSE